MKISYIITTYNRFEILIKHLKSECLTHRYINDTVEIIVADDGTKYTEEQIIEINRLADKFVCTDSFDKATPSKARNLGIAAATGELLIFADDDCLPHEDIILQFRILSRGNVGVGYKKGDKMILELDSNNKKEIEKSLEGMAAVLYFQRYLRGDFGHGHFTSGSFAIWREDLGDVKFDEDFVGYGYEDKHFGYLLRNKGLIFEYMIQAMSYHAHETFNRPREQKNEEAKKNKELMYGKING